MESLLGVTSRTPHLVNRTEETETIRKAIYASPKACHVVFVYGEGGMGKSRLVEEVLWRGGNPQAREPGDGRGPIPPEHPEWDWTQCGEALVGNIIDLTDTLLHTRTNLMNAIRNALIQAMPVNQPGAGRILDFSRYDASFKKLIRRQEYKGDYNLISELRARVTDEFFQDYQKNAAGRRLVLLFDTAEKLFSFGAQWLHDTGCLRPEDYGFSTFQWLAEQIEAGGFTNTTIIFVGRKEEGKFFFDLMRNATNKAVGQACALDEIQLRPFDREQTRAYLNEWVKANEKQPEMQRAAETLRSILESKDSKDEFGALWLYTGGQPVRLSLYSDLIVEGVDIPEPLNDSFAEAMSRVKTSDPNNSTPELEQARQEIEGEFISLLFARPTLRAKILKALVRSPRGLDDRQLHFLLGSRHDQTPQDWQENGDHKLLEQIQVEIVALKRFSIIKVRPNGRLGLQDEIYRIYAQNMAAREGDKADETRARQEHYQKMQAWAEFQRKLTWEELSALKLEDQRALRFEGPARALLVRFPYLSEYEQEKRMEMGRSLRDWELEMVHYALLRDPAKNLNHVAFDLSDRQTKANNEEDDAIAQEEEWQILKDDDTLAFIPIQGWEAIEESGETPIDVLRRVEEQSDVTRWLKRFVNRKELTRAIEFYAQVEGVIATFKNERVRKSWTHTFASGERKVWLCYARIYANHDIPGAVKMLEDVVNDFEKLLAADQFTLVFPERKENGFRGHPAEERLWRVLAQAYNILGFGYTRQGRIRNGMKNYGSALRCMRRIVFPAQQAATRNNLSAALSQTTYTRARRICLDGLSLRKEQGDEIPIGLSYNTLALIDNDNLRPDLAWVEAATALAYFNVAEDPRGQGLSLLQLGEALRRLARRGEAVGYVIPDRPDAIYSEAKKALDEAIGIFTDSPAKGERSRLVEAYIERGCLERDLIGFSQEKQYKQEHYREALYYLELALKLARELDSVRYQLEALVNMAWAHYYASDHDQAEKVFQQMEADQLFPEGSLIRENEKHPSSKRDDAYVYHELSRVYGLRGRMAMDMFNQRLAEIAGKTQERLERHKFVDEDVEARGYLQKAAESYVLALAYSELLSSRSNALSVIYGYLYDSLKKFNDSEMDRFTEFEREARKKYRISELKVEDLSNLDTFLRDCFGIEIEEEGSGLS